MRGYCCMAVGNSLEALCSVRLARALRASRDDPSSMWGGIVGLSRKPLKLRSWRCAQPRAAKTAAGVAVVSKMTSIPNSAAMV